MGSVVIRKRGGSYIQETCSERAGVLDRGRTLKTMDG